MEKEISIKDYLEYWERLTRGPDNCKDCCRDRNKIKDDLERRLKDMEYDFRSDWYDKIAELDDVVSEMKVFLDLYGEKVEDGEK